MQNFYEDVYRIIISFDYEDNISLDLRKELKLFETRKSSFGWSEDDDSLKIVTIEPERWEKIYLENHTNDEDLDTIIQLGGHLSAKSEVHSTEIDTKIQMAFIAFKMGVKLSEIEEVTNFHISQGSYKQLIEEFLKEFPEKLI